MGAQPQGVSWPKDGAVSPDLVGDGSVPLVAYVHVPFCTVRCGYCDFNTYTKDFGPGASLATYADSVVQEISLSKKVLEDAGLPLRTLNSVFFGGGTPSLMAPEAIAKILDALRGAYGLADGAEVTLEMNPETATATKIQGFEQAGVNRLSIGMQSASQRVLNVLDRAHDPAKVHGTLDMARSAGLSTSLDLIYGAPTETIEEWQQTLQQAVKLAPDHLSVYSLIVEPGTKMAAQIRRGQLPETDPDLDADKYRLADRILGQAGYDWYELSNFATTPQDRSVHNLAYWKNWDWWGFGPGAHSHLGDLRWWNVKHPLAYAGRLQAGDSPGFQGETLSAEDRHVETAMLGIRTRQGLPVQIGSPEAHDRLLGDGLVDPLCYQQGKLVLTLNGRLLADHVTRVLLDWE